MAEVTLHQILEAREKRVQIQKQLINQFKKPIISFTMNIAGPIKNSPAIERAFNEGVKFLKSRIPAEKIISEDIGAYDTGCSAFFSIDMTSHSIKQICEAIEEQVPIGRLFDMDVIDEDGNKLSRKDQRGCIVCGAEGRGCAAGRLHPVSELERVTKKIISDYFLEYDRENTAHLAVQSLIDEVRTTPKPGLVDSDNGGSHTDMNINTFIESANSLSTYFSKCFSLGYETRHLLPEDVFPLLRKEGIEAEDTMYKVTSGVNTHKGIIYSMGIICASIGRLWKTEKPFASLSDITRLCSQFVAESVRADFETIDDSTAGGYYYRKCGIKGIRGEVVSGFSSVMNISLPAYIQYIEDGFTPNDAGVFALINLIAKIKDTNLYHRGGQEGAEYASETASSLLKVHRDSFIKETRDIDAEFIKRNLSPGGCADLLAITYFLYSISKK